MAKSKIIKELANKEVSLEVAFNRLLIIASDLNNDDLVNWATIEQFAFGDNGNIGLYLTELAGIVHKKTSILCLKITMQFPKEIFIGLLSIIITKLKTQIL